VAISSQAELVEVLSTSRFEVVLGTPEDYWIEFKRDPYPLDTEKGRWEFAKDAAAIAADRGGVIVIGYATEKRPAEGGDYATSHHPVPKSRVNPDQYLDLLHARVYPAIEGIRTHWFPPESAHIEGVFVVEIPAQRDDAKPFAVTRMLVDEVEHPHFVGFPRRDGDRTRWLPPETIQHQVNLGRRLGQIPITPTTAPTPLESDLTQELEAAVEAAEAVDEPWLTYQSFPATSVGRIDSVTLGAIRKRLTDEPRLRPTGFNFRSPNGAEWEGGSVLQISARASFRVTDAGVVTACMPATRECLGWALNQYQPSDAPTRINPLTLVEQTLEYFRLSQLVAEHVPTIGWSTDVRARKMAEHRVYLEPGALPTGIPIVGFFAEHMAQTDDWTSRIRVEGDPQGDAYNALVSVYALFGLEEDAIPYASEGRIDIDAIRAAG
jgi:hypothetical protein